MKKKITINSKRNVEVEFEPIEERIVYGRKEVLVDVIKVTKKIWLQVKSKGK